MQYLVMTEEGQWRRREYNETTPYVTLTDDESATVRAKYEEIKPQLEEQDTYELIEMAALVDQDTATGILNCRVNGEHIQIRF